MAKPQYDYSEIARLREEENLTWREICERIGAPETSASTIRRGYERQKGTRVRVDGRYVKRDESEASTPPPSTSSPPEEHKPGAGASMASRQPSASPPPSQRHLPAMPSDLLATLGEVAEWWKSKQKKGDGAERADRHIKDGAAPLEALSIRVSGPLAKRTYRIEEKLVARIQELSKQTGESQSVIVNRALREYLER